MKCWAHTIGGCCKAASKEHIVSRAIFGDGGEIHVQGLPWCLEEPKAVGVDSLASQILCRTHNSRLAPLDSTAAETFRVFRQWYDWSPPCPNHGVTSYKVNGTLFERWLLKTAINFIFAFGVGTEGNFEKPRSPPRHLVEYVFGLRPMPRHSGFFMAAKLGDPLNENEGISFGPLTSGSEIIGGVFFLFAFTGVISWHPLGTINTDLLFHRVNRLKGRQLFRPGVLEHYSKETSRLAQRIEFTW